MLFLYTFALISFDKEGYIRYHHVINLIIIIVYTFIQYKKHTFMKYKFNTIIAQYFIFTIFCVMSVFWAIDFNVAILKALTLITISINILIIYNILKDLKSAEAVFFAFFFATFVNFLISLGLFGLSEEFYDGWRFMGTTQNVNILAIIMIFSIYISIRYLALQSTNRLFLFFQYVNIAIAIYIIILTGSKKGVLFGVLLILVYLLYQFKNVKSLPINILKILVVSFIVGYIAINYLDLGQVSLAYERFVYRIEAFSMSADTSTEERLYFIQEGLKQFANHPLVGLGIANFSVLYGTYAHNNYVELLADVGLIGFGLYYMIYVFIFVKIFKMKKGSEKVFLLLIMLVILIMEIAVVNYYSKFMFFMFAVFSFLAEKDKKRVI